MKNGIDILDEVKASVIEERKMCIAHWTIVSLVAMGVVLVCIFGFVSFDRYREEESVLAEANKLEMLITNINYIAQNIDNKNLSKNEVIEFRYNLDNNLKEMSKLFHDGRSAYAVKAGFILANIALTKKEYSNAVFYLSKISENMRFDTSFRDYAKLLLVQIKLTYRNEPSKNVSSEIDDYFFFKGNDIEKTFIKNNSSSKYIGSYFGVPFKFLHGALMLDQAKYKDAIDDFKEINYIVDKNDKDSSVPSLFIEDFSATSIMVRENLMYADYMNQKQQ